MRVFGNLMNRVAETVKPQAPTVGMGATIIYYSDRAAATIIEVNAAGSQIKIQRDKAIRTDGNKMSDSQSYRYEADPNGEIRTATLRKNGTFVMQKEQMRNGTIVRVGERSEYYDYGF